MIQLSQCHRCDSMTRVVVKFLWSSNIISIQNQQSELGLQLCFIKCSNIMLSMFKVSKYSNLSAHPAKSSIQRNPLKIHCFSFRFLQWIFQWNLCCRTERWNFKIHWILHPVDLKFFETERNAGISNSTGWLHPVEFDEIPLDGAPFRCNRTQSQLPVMRCVRNDDNE